ncbi:hypothetical protein COCON_G00105030 [Conger conger]|uniref:Sperm-associated antigen 5 n=1 Tax=Conger conger TaxID=82655 RepID=A0A9Q1DIM1_CONCO|nr:hypothetical protein COCON_G00105030 [Conger conger]
MMAARRGFQANGDNTSVVRPAERVPLRNLQNELLGQQLALSATKVFSKSPFKKKGETVQGEGLPHCSPLCRASNGIAPLIETALTKENTATNTAKQDESVAQKGCPDSLLADLIDKGVEPQTRTSFSSVLIQSDMTDGKPSTGQDVPSVAGGPGCPWNTVDSPVGPRGSRLCMGILESPMPLPQLNSTLIQPIPIPTTATPQTREPDSGVLPTPAKGGTGPELAPLQTKTSFSSVLIQSDITGTALTGNAEDVSGMGLTGRAEEWANSVSAPDQQASVGCLSDSLTSCQTQTATGDSAVEPCTDGRAGEVTFRSLHCSGVELEIADTSSLPEESVVLLPERSADLSSCCSFQKNCSGHLDFSQHVGLNPSNKSEDHAYCLQKRGGSCFRDALLPEECSEKSVTADQSQDKTENIVTADQSRATVTADQMQNKVEQSLSADQSQDKTENCVPAQAQDTTEKSLVADQSQGIAEKGLAVDQSQSTAVQGLVAECREHDAVLQTGGSDVTPGHGQERYSETPSCVETGSPALAKTSRLWQEAPGCPWNTVDSPVGPRGSRLCMGILESPMPQPQLNSTLIQPIPTPTTATSQTRSLIQDGKPSTGQDIPSVAGGPGCPWDTVDSPVGPRGSRLCMGILESPMPQPQLNSTLIQPIPTPTTATSQTREPDSGVLPTPAQGDIGPELAPLQTPGDLTDTETGPPQENLAPQTPGRLTETQTGPLGPQAPGHQACTKSEPLQMLGALWTPGDLAGPQSGPLQERLLQMGALLLRASQNMAPAVEQHSASTWTSPVALVERSVNTSGLFERRREVSVAEASTSTDSLHWIVAPEAVAGWSRRDLEQRFFSSITMVEALSQQLASAQTHTHHTPPISELRDRVVQTDLTELSQGVMYRELCVRALERLRTLELQQEQQERLLQELRSSSTAMAAMAAETDQALSSVNEMGQMASEDQDSISQQMCRMRALYGRFRQAHRRMEERVERCEQEKLLTEQQREEALRTKEASLLVLEQLQCRHAAQVAELERSVGSHLELIPALSTACQEQVSLNEEYVESLQAADELLKGTISDQSRLSEELSKARFLLRRTGPVLLKLHQEAATALQAQNQQQRDTEEIQDELELTASRLYDAQQQIGDLNLQVTILTSEMAVLRQRMGEVEEERATLSSTQGGDEEHRAALNAQTKRMEEVQEESSQRVEELERALAERDVQLAQEQAGLLELQTQLASTCEINEFLQMESEVSLEQVAQSEALVKSHLQGLRERNLECEDLKQELGASLCPRDAVQEEVLTTREKTRNLLLDMGNQLALASTDITLLHHKVYMLTCALKTTLNTTLSTQKPDRSCKEREPPSLSAPPRRSTRSFVDSVMVATTEEADETDECPSAALGSGNSAFTRVTTAIPKQDVKDDCRVLELLAGLGDAVSQLVSTVDCVREIRDHQCEELQLTVSSLQEELDSQGAGYRSQVADLKAQVSHLQAQVEKDALALQQKAQEEKTLRKLCSDLDESRELCQQQKCENKELCRELSGLRWSLQQAQLEAQLLRKELCGGQAEQRLPALEEKVRLQMEVDKLRKNLSETEDSRSKLIDRAKKHQVVLEANQRKLQKELQILDQTMCTVKQTLSSIPEVVKECEQLEELVAYLG